MKSVPGLQIVVKKEYRMLLSEQGYTVLEASKKAGISQLTMRSALAGKPISAATAKKICDAFGIYMWDYFQFADEV